MEAKAMKPKKRCGKSGCRLLVDYDKQYCNKHTNHSTNAYNKHRYQYDREYVSFYSSTEWRAKRRQALLQTGFQCVRCESEGMVTTATMVHHIQTVKDRPDLDRKSTRLNSSHVSISYAVFC